MKAKARTWKPRKRSPRPYTGRSKYGAIPTVVDGIRFHSKAEARRYSELKIAEQAGEITDLELQPEFPLYALSENNDPQRLGVYRGDFRYKAKTYNPKAWPWRSVVEDVKGMDTPLSRWKRKHVLAQYGIQVEIVK